MMMRLLTISFFVSLVFSLPSALCAQIQNTQNTNQTTNELDRYEAVINANLRTLLDEEKAYLNQAFELVRRGRLPKQVIDRSFLWVRKKRPHAKYKFIYFERVMRYYAAQYRAPVPPFDLSVYNKNGAQVVNTNVIQTQVIASPTVGSTTFGATTQGSVVIPDATTRNFIIRNR